MSGKKRLLIYLAIILVVISMVPGLIKMDQGELILEKSIKPVNQKEVVFTVTEAGCLHMVKASTRNASVKITLLDPSGEVLRFPRTKPWWWGWNVGYIEFTPQVNGDYTVNVDSKAYGVTVEVRIDRKKTSQ